MRASRESGGMSLHRVPGQLATRHRQLLWAGFTLCEYERADDVYYQRFRSELRREAIEPQTLYSARGLASLITEARAWVARHAAPARQLSSARPHSRV